MNRLREILDNRWVKFSFVSLIYILWFVIWAQTWWAIFGVIVIFDIYVSKLYMKLFWGKHLRIKENNSFYRSVSGWVEAIVFAVVAASLIRTCFVELYVIPSSSMEKSLLIGDYLGVSKVSYGPKLPNTPLAIPFVHNTNPLNPRKKSYSDLISLPYKRLKGFGNVERGDVIVFNFPAGDTVIVDMPQANYYDIVRDYGKQAVENRSEIIYHPVDKRDNYVKRAVAVPGDKLQVIDGEVFINGTKEDAPKGRQYLYLVTMDGDAKIPGNVISNMNIASDDISYHPSRSAYQTYLTQENVEKMKGMRGVTGVDRYIETLVTENIFPNDTARYKWTVDNFGPLYIPKKGEMVELNLDVLPMYSRIINNYEGNKLEVKDGIIYVNDNPTDKYTFAMDYYFAMGDNRHNSLDSRIWGFIPEDHIVGKASFVWLSLDKEKSFPKNIRFSRMFKSIK